MEYILLIFIALLGAAFFSGMELAFISSNKLKIELENKQGTFAAKIASFFLKYPSRFIATMLVGYNVSLVLYAVICMRFLEILFPEILSSSRFGGLGILFIEAVIATLLFLFTAELLPRSILSLQPNRALNIFAIPLILSYFIFYPLVFIILEVSEFILEKIFGVELSNEKTALGKIDLDHYIREFASASDSSDGSDEIELFQKAMDFVNVRVKECMIPRNEIIAMEVNEEVEVLRRTFAETGLSKILVYENSIDQIIGFTHSYDMFRKPINIRSILLPISIVTETMPASELLDHFTRQHKSIALVLDEFGVTSGIVTLEDVIEEIFGEIEDEHDLETTVEKKLSENEFIFSGRAEIDYINGKYFLDIPSSDQYETLAGFIFQHFARIPRYNEIIEIPPFRITILSVSDTRIERVKLKVLEE